MSLSDPIGDMLARIKNSQMRNHKKMMIITLIQEHSNDVWESLGSKMNDPR